MMMTAHKGVAGNNAADRAARQSEMPGPPTMALAQRVRERAKVIKIVEETVRRESVVSPSLWGRFTYKLDAMLPGIIHPGYRLA
jgi:hypothetical protein